MTPDRHRYIILNFLPIESGKEIGEVAHLFDTMVHTFPSFRFGCLEKPEPASHLTSVRQISDNVDNATSWIFFKVIGIGADYHPVSGFFES